MLHLNRQSDDPLSSWRDRSFRELPGLLRPDDLVVINNTRVFPARLYGRRSGERAQEVSARNPAARDFLRGRDRRVNDPRTNHPRVNQPNWKRR